MRFQAKMIGGYAILVFLLALVIGLSYNNYMVDQYEKAEATNTQVLADQLKVQVEERISKMELATEYILSEPNILEGIHILGMEEEGIHQSYIGEARNAIRSGITTYYLTNNFYRAVWFNRSGEVFSTYNHIAGKASSEADFSKMLYLERAEQGRGKPILVNSHEDIWGLKTRPQVLSLVKAVQGNNMGFIEIQYLVSDLGELQLPKENVSYVIFLNEGELLYSSEEKTDINILRELLKNNEMSDVQRIRGGENSLVAKSVSSRYAVTVFLLEGLDQVSQIGAYAIPAPFVIALAFFIISMIFVIALSHILTEPLRRLRSAMENTKLENIGQDVALSTPNDEIQALSVSYRMLMRRLQESMIKEQRLSMLQLQAQFDSLQAQVNPHFLYNVLNIISARGMSDGDEKICEMCGSLAAMLRYSTNNKERYATVKQEMEYLDQYFYLIKTRYEHKIDFKVNIEKSIQKEILPKVALQQIVENCINHGFENSTDQMLVEVTGWREKSGWYIKIHDNGQGFENTALTSLRDEMKNIRQQILCDCRNMELEIGGMGLINVYARLLLLYNDKLVFRMENDIEGANVIIGNINTEKE